MATEIRILIRRRIRRLREKLGWTQLDLAVAMDPVENQNYISVIERGKTDPTATMLQRVANGLGVHISAIFVDIEAEGIPDDPKKPRRR